MASTPLKINDKRGKSQGWSHPAPSTNSLFRAATQSNEQEATPNLSFDTYRNVSRLGITQLQNVGKFIFANFSPVHGAVLEQAELSVGHFIPQFVGADREWGRIAERQLIEWERIMDIRGWPYDGNTYRKNLITTCRVVGDHLTILTETETGYPMIQVVGTHRIGSKMGEDRVSKGIFDGASIFNGVIVDDFGRVLGYRVYGDGYASGEYQDISASDAFLMGFADYCDQYRFFSSLASSACDWKDVYERRKFEMLAQKLGSSIALIEKNELGEPMPGQGTVARPSSTATPTSETGIATELYEGGTIKFFKSNSGSGLESLRLDRPSADSQAFEAAIIRGAFKGMEWDVDFSLDPSKVGGASMRVVVEKINTTIRKNQQLVEKAMRRIHGWAIRKFIKLGLIPDNDEWYMWEYQGPGEVTADRKYDSDVDIAEIAQGLGTKKKSIARRGGHYDDVRSQRKQEVDDELTDAGELAKKHGITIEQALVVLRPPTPNGNLPQPQQVKSKEKKSE